jgi:hypothetical protein
MTKPIRLDRTPLTVTADVEALVDRNVEELLDALAGDLFEDFMTAVCEESTGHDGHAAERLAFERLREQLVERLTTRVSLTGPEAVRVGERMADLGHSLDTPRGASEIRHPAMRATRQYLKANPLPEQDRRAS